MAVHADEWRRPAVENPFDYPDRTEILKLSRRCVPASMEFEYWRFHRDDRGRRLVAHNYLRCGGAERWEGRIAPEERRRLDRFLHFACLPGTVFLDNLFVRLLAARANEVRRLRKLRAEIESKSEYVGPRFSEDARKIHYEEAPARGIHGEATVDEAKALKEEGIEFYPLPILPEDQN